MQLNSSADTWLVRTSLNVIAGPYHKEEICQLIENGKLGPYDEVCESGSYWFFIHEREEVQKRLKNIDLPSGDIPIPIPIQTEAKNPEPRVSLGIIISLACIGIFLLLRLLFKKI